MKIIKYIFIAYNLLIYVGLFAQNLSNTYIIEDFDYNEKQFTVYDSEGYEIANGFAQSENEINLSLISENPKTEYFGKDEFQQNIYLPYNEKGVMPKSICLNPVNNKIYIYGGQKVLIYNSLNGNFITDISVSETGNLSDYGIYFANYQKRLIYNNTNNSIYCATDGNELVIIDGVSNQVVKTIIATEVSNQLMSSLAYSDGNNRLYWIINTWFGESKYIKVVDCASNEVIITKESQEATSDIIINQDGSKVYLANSKGLYEYDIDLVQATTLFNNPVSKIELAYGINKLFAAHWNDYNFTVINLNNGNVGTYPYDIEMAFNSKYNPTDHKIYFTGKGTEKKFIIIDVINNEVQLTSNNGNPFGLDYSISENRVYTAGNNSIYAYSGETNGILGASNLEGSFNFKVYYNPDVNNVISLNKNDGNITYHNNNVIYYATEQMGGGVIRGCFNPAVNKYYITQTERNNEHSFVTIINAQDNEVTLSIPLGNNIKGCAYNPYTEKVYITCKEGNTNKLMVFDDETYEDVSLGNYYPQRGLSFTQDEILVGCYNKIISIDPETYQITPKGLIGYANFISIDDLNNRIFVSTICNNSTGKAYILDMNLNIINSFDLNGSPLDMVYNPNYQKLYIASTGSITNVINLESGILQTLDTPSCSNLFYHSGYKKLYVLCRIYENNVVKNLIKIYDGYTNSLIKIIELDQFHSGLTYNSVNDEVYTHCYYDYSDNFTMNFKAIDCFTDEVVAVTSVEQKQRPGIMFLPYNHDLIFNSNDNKMVSTNMGFSNISVVQCNTDKLQWSNSEWHWLSFPRLECYNNEPAPSIPALERLNCFPCPLNMHYMTTSFSIEYVQNPVPLWQGDLQSVQSTKGYKLNIESNMETKQLPLHGVKLDPETEITLYPDQENWTGYFIDYPQYPKDCFDDDDWDALTEIKTQYWTMIKMPSDPPYWYIKGKVTPFEYGDLVILRTNTLHAFSWISSGTPAEADDIPKTEYYTYEEQADYVPVFVQFDEASDVQEVAVIAEGTVRGAAVREPGDTIVEVNSYLEGTSSGAPLEFETWSGNKSVPVEKNGYVVYNPLNRKKEKRTIYAGEPSRFHYISLKQNEVYEIPDAVSDVLCLPNPFDNNTAISFRLNKEMYVCLEVYDISGKKINTLLEGELPDGYYNTIWNGDNKKGDKVNNGIYFYRIRTQNGLIITKKIVKI